jgi:ABC-type molybdate transport system substrate-binding protein
VPRLSSFGLSAAAVQVPLTELAVQFTRDTGHRVTFESDAATVPLPDALQLAMTYTAWIPDPANPTARLFVKVTTGAQGRARFRAAGFD